MFFFLSFFFSKMLKKISNFSENLGSMRLGIFIWRFALALTESLELLFKAIALFTDLFVLCVARWILSPLASLHTLWHILQMFLSLNKLAWFSTAGPWSIKSFHCIDDSLGNVMIRGRYFDIYVCCILNISHILADKHDLCPCCNMFLHTCESDICLIFDRLYHK